MASEKESFLDNLFKIGALIGGAWLLAEVIKLFSERVYTCPNCGYIIQERVNECPHCHIRIVWKVE